MAANINAIGTHKTMILVITHKSVCQVATHVFSLALLPAGRWNRQAARRDPGNGADRADLGMLPGPDTRAKSGQRRQQADPART